MVTYLAKFIPNLSDESRVLRELEKKGVDWQWSSEHQHVFNRLKDCISNVETLKYFDPNSPITIQTDASDYALGCVLLQEEKPVYYASRSLTKAEINYAPIEKEALGILFSVNKFHQYIYGKKITVITDHKPLEIIHKKPILRAPKRLQRILMYLQEYDLIIKWQPGRQMLIADQLSRAIPDEHNTVLKDYSMNTPDLENINALEFIPIADKKMKEIAVCNREDQALQ